jgi:murein DD-endopeptidase MepM/ murein hydrolase activator NlpD
MTPLLRLRLVTLALGAALPFLLWSLLPVGSSADPTPEQIQRKIDRNNSLIGGHKARERVLTTEISSHTRKINELQADISRLSTRQQKLQARLDAKREELARVQRLLRAERARLTRLRARLVEVRRALADRLVEMYKAGQPDVITVVLEADGFADLLTRTEFMARISRQDAKIMRIVANAKADAEATAARLDKLERREKRVTKQIQADRDEVADLRAGLIDRRDRIRTARSNKYALLQRSRERRHELQDDIDHLRAQQAKIQARLAGFSGPVTAGPIRPGSSGMIWPVNGPLTSPFCESRAWESCHPGIDIAAPTGTPIRAALSGRVVLIQGTGSSGGYGNFTCIQHAGALSTCYAHQSAFATSVGAQVSQGQVIGYVGSTGRSTGPHLHFETRINGAVVSPMNYL